MADQSNTNSVLTAEQWEEHRQWLEKAMQISIRHKRIRAIDVNSSTHGMPPLFIEVGKVCAHMEVGSTPELVLAIFESTTFLVCTKTRGIDNNLPYFFARPDVRRVIEFDKN